uniref:Lymphoid-restricted membrane protein n=1 Tax=Mola mola TaxID=94237 RepID=A0A3Q3W6L8_MOLML
MDVPVSPNRRHNPVDSICRKLQTIQWRGDREPNSPFQIPKFSSSSYDSPQCGFRHNLEAMLKKGALHRDKGERDKESASSLGSSVPLSTPACNLPTPANVTYTITSTLGERRGADGSDWRQVKTWQRYCSTPTGQSKESPYFTFTRGPQSVLPENKAPSRSPPLSHTLTPNHNTFSCNLNFCSADAGNSPECELPYPALVVKRLSMGDGGSSLASENRKENMAEISLICEENLLDTIFYACDTQQRGKVCVSDIVDYLRHTTSRSSEDSGLEDLCNMLDPEHKDVSIDLDTYHAVMKEWIEDCQLTQDVTQDSIKLRDSLSAKRSMLLNMTSGSLEAFGGEASRAEFETSELVYCVADLQMSNQKLQEEVKKMKQVVEGMEDTNQKLAEENEELRSKARVNQLLAQKEKMLKEEVEEMKATLNCTEEGRARASAHSKHMVSPIQANIKVTMELDELQRRITELCDINADLQVTLLPVHFFSFFFFIYLALHYYMPSLPLIARGVSFTHFSFLILRADKSKLENQMKMIHPDLSGAGLPLSAAYRLNQSSSGSLQTELALAQSPLEVIDYLSTSMSVASSLDETLDREVLMMLQGPSPEHMAQEFKSLLNKLKKDFKQETNSVLSTIRGSTVQAELDARRADWALSLDQLAQYTDSLEKELIKMASNMRRSRTEILHLSVRVQEQENQKRQLCEELEQLKTPQDSREASCQTPAPEKEPGDDLDWDEEFALQDFLKNELAERNCREQGGPTDTRPEETADKLADRGGQEDSEEKWMVVDRAGEAEVRDTSTPLSALSGEVKTLILIKQGVAKNGNLIYKWQNIILHLEHVGRCYLQSKMHSRNFTVRNFFIFLVCFQAEFQRLALSFKCDMFTLEKRLRLEERSRNLAEENVRREVSSCQGLLQALIPLCEDDNQSMEIIQRLQKNLDILIQSMTRVSSRSEMLGAIHQESRIGKAVEVMIQHVENLRRMYTKEHSELLELRETLMQNERSFGSHTERDDFRSKKQQISQYYKSSSRRVSIAAIPRSGGGNMNVAGKGKARPPLKRFVSSAAWFVDRLQIQIHILGSIAGLLALLATLVMQPVVDAAPMGTGDSWMTIQQLLWPYAGLRHNGQPPV